MNTQNMGEGGTTAASALFPYPYGTAIREVDPALQKLALHVRDLASSNLRANGKPLRISELVTSLKRDPRLERLSAGSVEILLKCCVASGALVANVLDKTSHEVLLSLSKSRQDQEQLRSFAASFGDELSTLSRRVASLIRHGPSVGSYRENLLQELLRVHIPDRYHVATGFILGCERQVDILIYDRLDFAPVFKQGDMVVVPLEAVRGVIEVKTNLTCKNLRESLKLLSEIPDTHVFGAAPPMFKGIFAFASAMSSDSHREVVAGYYDVDLGDEEYAFTGIDWPFAHISALCVHESIFLRSTYMTCGSSSYRPFIQSIESLTNLKPQAGLFLAHLRAHLPIASRSLASFDITHILGADIFIRGTTAIAPERWGPYRPDPLSEDPEEDALRARNADSYITRVMRWLAGEAWDDPRNEERV
jgi:hypothetical protein